jgi:hypothetical protein
VAERVARERPPLCRRLPRFYSTQASCRRETWETAPEAWCVGFCFARAASLPYLFAHLRVLATLHGTRNGFLDQVPDPCGSISQDDDVQDSPQAMAASQRASSSAHRSLGHRLHGHRTIDHASWNLIAPIRSWVAHRHGFHILIARDLPLVLQFLRFPGTRPRRG